MFFTRQETPWDGAAQIPLLLPVPFETPKNTFMGFLCVKNYQLPAQTSPAFRSELYFWGNVLNFHVVSEKEGKGGGGRRVPAVKQKLQKNLPCPVSGSSWCAVRRQMGMPALCLNVFKGFFFNNLSVLGKKSFPQQWFVVVVPPGGNAVELWKIKPCCATGSQNLCQLRERMSRTGWETTSVCLGGACQGHRRGQGLVPQWPAVGFYLLFFC